MKKISKLDFKLKHPLYIESITLIVLSFIAIILSSIGLYQLKQDFPDHMSNYGFIYLFGILIFFGMSIGFLYVRLISVDEDYEKMVDNREDTE